MENFPYITLMTNKIFHCPVSIKQEMLVQVEKIKPLHNEDLSEGFGEVHRPDADICQNVKGELKVSCQSPGHR